MDIERELTKKINRLKATYTRKRFDAVDFRDEDHPRRENGQFAPKGQGESSGKPRKVERKKSTPKGSGQGKNPHARRKFTERTLKGGTGKTDTSDRGKNDSLSKYCDKSGKLSSKREALHRRIVADHFIDVTKPKTGEPKVFTFLGGGPASGKSTAMKGVPDYPKAGEAVMVDADEIKKKIPEYKKMTKAGDNTAAAYAHEESSALVKRTVSAAQKNGYNVLWDGTGDGSVASMKKKIAQAKASGYTVNLRYVTCSIEEALNRAKTRAAKTGREVPYDVVINTHKKVSEILPQIASICDDVQLWDTNGKKPKLIAVGGKGRELTPIKGCRDKVNEFLDKTKENWEEQEDGTYKKS